VSVKMNELRFAFKRESEWSPATRTPSPTPWGDSVRFYVCGSPVVFLPSDQPVGAFVCSAGDPGSPLRRLPAGPSFWQRMAASARGSAAVLGYTVTMHSNETKNLIQHYEISLQHRFTFKL
jgi:hypothetical protein